MIEFQQRGRSIVATLVQCCAAGIESYAFLLLILAPMKGDAHRVGARRPSYFYERSDLNAARISAVKSSGCSQAAK
jgi:hypothetical protein